MTDTRKDKRAPLSLKVRFKSATLDEFVEQYSQDLSRGGIFIKSKKPMKIGTLLKFEFQLKDESSLIHGVGRVVWVRAPEEATDASPAGMGIKFIKMDGDSRALVQEIVDRRGGGTGAFEAGETGSDAGDEGGSFFPDSGPAQLPPPEDRTSVRHASEFLAEALMGAGVSAADEAKESAEEARRRGAEIQKKREEEAKAREAAAAAAAKRAAEVPKGSASAPTIDDEAKPRRAAPAEVTGTDEIPTLIASRAELDAAREEAESATTLAEEPKEGPSVLPAAAGSAAAKEAPKAAPKEEPRAAAKEPAKAEPAKAAPKKDETPRLVMPNEPERPPPPKEPSSMPVVVVVLVLVALGVGGWFFFLRDSGEPASTTPVAQPEPTPQPPPPPPPPAEPEPEPEPEPVATTRVRVTSTPAAEIFVGGTSVGTTTADGLEIELPIGVASTVEARAAGFGSSSIEVSPVEGTAPDPITFRLAALPYVIEIATEPSGARVSANNRNLQSPGEVRLDRWTRDVSVFANLTGYDQGSQVVRQTDFVERDGAMRATVRIVLTARATVVPSMTTTMVAAMMAETTETTETTESATTETPAMVEEPPAMVEEPPAMVEAPPPAMTEEPVPDNPF